jgi:DNA-binding transcriptional MerR regulator
LPANDPAIYKQKGSLSVERMTIGEFSKRSRLSAKALRLYDELGLLLPAEVDPCSGYRPYVPAQLEPALLISTLRQLGFPLADIKAVIGLEREAAAERIAELWAHAEAEHDARKELAGYLVARLSGKEPVMYEVSTREIPDRTVLCLKRNVQGDGGAWAFGKEFISLIRGKDLLRVEGRAGAMFCIWWGLVNDDSDGPLEWCLPVPGDHAKALATRVPELSVRTEPAHKEAFVQLPTPVIGARSAADLPPTQWELVTQSLHSWAASHGAQPSDLGVRTTYLATLPITETSVPDCDFAVPFA